MLYRAGLRIIEALSLYPKDIQLDKGIVRVLNGEGGKSRTFGIDPGAAVIIQRRLGACSNSNMDTTDKSRPPFRKKQPFSGIHLIPELSLATLILHICRGCA